MEEEGEKLSWENYFKKVCYSKNVLCPIIHIMLLSPSGLLLRKTEIHRCGHESHRRCSGSSDEGQNRAV